MEIVFDFNDFTHKICQKLPFSNILLLMSDSEYFEFGNTIFNQFLNKGAKVHVALIKEDNFNQLDDLLSQKNLLLDFRGVVIFNKQILCHILGGLTKIPKVFYLQLSSDIYGIFDNGKSQLEVERYFYPPNKNVCEILKIFAVRTLYLIDYIFCQALNKSPLDSQFFSRVKRLIVSAVTNINDCEKNLDEIFDVLIKLENLSTQKEKSKYFSASVTCYLMQNNFYHLQTNYLASKKIVKAYKNLLLNKKQEKIDLSTRARLVSYFSRQQINSCLMTLCNQMEKIDSDISLIDKREIITLLNIYNKFVCKIEKGLTINPARKDIKSKLFGHKLDMCISVCGDTMLSINGMTFARQNSLIF